MAAVLRTMAIVLRAGILISGWLGILALTFVGYITVLAIMLFGFLVVYTGFELIARQLRRRRNALAR